MKSFRLAKDDSLKPTLLILSAVGLALIFWQPVLFIASWLLFTVVPWLLKAMLVGLLIYLFVWALRGMFK